MTELLSIGSLDVTGSRVVVARDYGFGVLARDTGVSRWPYEPESASRLSFRIELVSVFVSYVDNGETTRSPLDRLRVPESLIRQCAPHQLTAVPRGYPISKRHEPMNDMCRASPLERLIEATETRTDDEVSNSLRELLTASPEDQKRAFRELRDLADDRPTAPESLMPAVTPFLTDDECAVRLLTTEAFIAVTEADFDAVAPTVSALVERLTDEDEFYYVHTQSAEALGYVALGHPGTVASPAALADLRVGLSFDEPKVRQKLAKVLECIALDDPGRPRHHASALAEHFDDGGEPVRYHFCTAIAGVGCDSPDLLATVRGALSARLVDENAFARGRAAEVLELLAGECGGHRDHGESAAVPDPTFGAESNEVTASVTEQIEFLRASMEGDTAAVASTAEGVSTLAGIRRTIASAVTEITSPDAEGVCPHCGIGLAESTPPMCPSCNAPY